MAVITAENMRYADSFVRSATAPLTIVEEAAAKVNWNQK